MDDLPVSMMICRCLVERATLSVMTVSSPGLHVTVVKERISAGTVAG
jgi:hypothetical protein